MEILIVGAMIALFAGMAIINIQQSFQSNLRKITMAETHQIATALSFAHQDISIFPKFCFLDDSLNVLLQAPPVGDIPFDFDYMGFALEGQRGRIMEEWNGGYFAMSQTRRNVAQGTGGITEVILPYSNETVSWPADPWGNPYVLYLLFMNSRGQVDFIFEPSQDPDFAASVVSYGPNRTVGGLPRAEIDSADLEALKAYRLYVNDRAPFRMLGVNEFTREMARRYYDPGSITGGAVTVPDSDDIYFEF